MSIAADGSNLSIAATLLAALTVGGLLGAWHATRILSRVTADCDELDTSIPHDTLHTDRT